VVDAAAGQLADLREAVEGSPELAEALASPQLDSAAKKALVARLTEGAEPVVANFLQVLVDRGRIAELVPIAEAVEQRVAEAENRLEVTAVTAVSLSDELREKIVQRIKRETGSDVDLEESVDPDVIGGLVLEVEGVRIDGSVRRRIEGLRARLAAAPVPLEP
jgi:F-type H+-transporting ATPase subunit delta